MISSLYSKMTNGINAPLYQAAVALVCLVVGCIISTLFYDESKAFMLPWTILSTMILCYSLYNSIISVTSKQLAYYFQRSVFGYLGLLFIGAAIAKLFSHLDISEAGSMKWLFVVFTLGYIVIFLIMFLARKIMEYAQSTD